MDHEHYDQRMDFVKSILQLNDLQAEIIEPVEYDMNTPFPYNNFIYLVTLTAPTTSAQKLKSAQNADTQPGSVLFPANSAHLIVRLANSNPLTGMNNTNRVENEVAFMTLARQALTNSKYSHIVPDVYTWASTSTGQGFTMQQYMRGTMPARGFDALSLQDKSVVFGQMSDILALLQRFKIPRTVDRFGGLKFDEQSGEVISAQMAIFTGDPSLTYKDFLRNIFRVKLGEADDNPVMRGWKENGVRVRLDDFIDNRLDDIFKNHNDTQKVLVHGDFTTGNLLFDAASLEVTALLDYDFSYVAMAADEYMGYSFGNIPGGNLPGPYESTPQLHLRNAILTGDFTPSTTADCSEIQWDEASAWHEALARAGAARPSNISRFKEIADIYWFMDKISPFELDNPMMRKRKTEEQLEAARREAEALIVRFLHSASADDI